VAKHPDGSATGRRGRTGELASGEQDESGDGLPCQWRRRCRTFWEISEVWSSDIE